jgi:hypothetical protein
MHSNGDSRSIVLGVLRLAGVWAAAMDLWCIVP